VGATTKIAWTDATLNVWIEWTIRRSLQESENARAAYAALRARSPTVLP
jgi:hypothetical protein